LSAPVSPTNTPTALQPRYSSAPLVSCLQFRRVQTITSAKVLNMDRTTLPSNTRDENGFFDVGRKRSLQTRQECEVHTQAKKTQNTGDIEKPQSLQDRDPAHPPGDTDTIGGTGNPGGRDNRKGKSASTESWSVPKTARTVEEWYYQGLALITNLPYPADAKDELLRRLRLWASAQRAIYQDIES
jgi:hypothetical protein